MLQALEYFSLRFVDLYNVQN